jgi:signal transduction histidine kinase
VAVVNPFTPEPAAAWLASRLQAETATLATKWVDQVVEMLVASGAEVFPSREILHDIPDFIAEIAQYLRLPDSEQISRNSGVMRSAAELGRIRFRQRATVHQLLREYQVLAELLEGFLLAEVANGDPPLAAEAVGRVMHRVSQSLRVLQQQTVDTFVAIYTDAIQRQHAQLIAFGRLVGQEMRQPLGVLQVMSGVLPVREGDMEFTNLVDVFDRNVRRLADVAARLERLSHVSLEETLIRFQQPIALSEVVAGVVEKLSGMARGRDVQMKVDAELPVLDVDIARTEIVFGNLIANAIKYSDPEKPMRLIEVVTVRDALTPTVIVRDNGVGISSRRVQHLFREFARAHAHRDGDLRGQGLGLGLSMVRECMDAAGGSVRLESEEGQWTTVTLSWPNRTKAAPPSPSSGPSART